jgi:predicted DNA-binding ribbon-helix-helix protein
MNITNEERRCLELGDRRACVGLESDFWECLDLIAEQSGTTVDRLATAIGGGFEKDELSAALRVFVLTHFREGGGWLGPEGLNEDIAGRPSLDKMSKKHKSH